MPTVVELKAELKELGLPTYGLKAELQGRLQAYYNNRNNNNNSSSEAAKLSSQRLPQDSSCNGNSSIATVGRGKVVLMKEAGTMKDEKKIINSKNTTKNGSSSSYHNTNSNESVSSIKKHQQQQKQYYYHVTIISFVLLAIGIANITLPVCDVDLLPESITSRLLPLLQQQYRNRNKQHTNTLTTEDGTAIIHDVGDMGDDKMVDSNTDDANDINVDLSDEGASEESMISNDNDNTSPEEVINDEIPLIMEDAHTAGRMGDMATLTAMARNGIELLNVHDNNGWTPLHEAARYGHLEVVKFLINIGLDKVSTKPLSS
jgi:ankyrin repeat protein